jgi:hypothetical protein
MSWEPWTAFGYRGDYRTVKRCGPIPFVLERTAEGQYRAWVQGSSTRDYPTAELALAAGHRNVKIRLRRLIKQAQAALAEPVGAVPPWGEEDPR